MENRLQFAGKKYFLPLLIGPKGTTSAVKEKLT
jgi:hypothetical protein